MGLFDFIVPGLKALGQAAQSNPVKNALIPGLVTAGGALANRGESSVSSPNLSPEQLKMRDSVLQQFSTLNDPTKIEASGVSDINRTADLERQKLEENLALRGVTGPAAAAALNSQDSRRFASVTQYRQQLPLIRAQLLNQNLTALNSTGTTTKTSGNKVGGAFAGLGSYLAYLHGRGLIGGGSGTGNTSKGVSAPGTSQPAAAGPVFAPAPPIPYEEIFKAIMGNA